MKIIPDIALAIHAANHLLREMQRISNPTEEQRRFTGSLRKAMGYQSRNDMTKRR